MQHEYIKRLAERMNKQLAGKVKVEVYPAEQLGNNARMLEGLALGTVEAVIGPPEFIVGVDPRFQIVGRPGLIKDMRPRGAPHPGREIPRGAVRLRRGEGHQGHGLVMYGANVWATRKPVKSLADFKGMKVRVLASQMHTVPLQHIGATGVPMAPSEAVQALSSGAIDGVRTGMTIFTTFKYYDIVKNVTSARRRRHDSLDVLPQQEMVRRPAEGRAAARAGHLEGARAGDEPVERGRRSSRPRRTWKARGGQIHRITGPDQVEFQKRMHAAADEVAQKNPRIKEAYNLMVERAKATAR